MKKDDKRPTLSPIESLKTENNLLKSKLTAEFGMKELNSGLELKAENEWLNYIYEWETQFAQKKSIKVYDRIGRPDFVKLDELEPNEISPALDRLLLLMEENALVLDCICEYDDSIVYKFITEELFNEEIDDIRIKGMNTRFIYEEFHPNHEYDIRELAEGFFQFFLSADWDPKHGEFQLADPIQYNNRLYNRNDCIKKLLSFREDAKPIKLELIGIENVSFDIEKRKGTANGEISFSVSGDEYPAHVSGLFKMDVEFNDYYWEISELNFPWIE